MFSGVNAESAADMDSGSSHDLTYAVVRDNETGDIVGVDSWCVHATDDYGGESNALGS